MIKALYNKKGLKYNETSTVDIKAHKQNEYNKLATELRKSLDMEYIYKIIGDGISL